MPGTQLLQFFEEFRGFFVENLYLLGITFTCFERSPLLLPEVQLSLLPGKSFRRAGQFRLFSALLPVIRPSDAVFVFAESDLYFVTAFCEWFYAGFFHNVS